MLIHRFFLNCTSAAVLVCLFSSSGFAMDPGENLNDDHKNTLNTRPTSSHNIPIFILEKGITCIGEGKYEEAFERFTLAAALDDDFKNTLKTHFASSNNEKLLNFLFDKGNNFLEERKDAEAFKVFNCAAILGDELSLSNVGIHYMQGIGVKQNLMEAIKIFKDLEKKECSYVYCNLGYCYEQLENYPDAVHYYKLALDPENVGNSLASFNLAFLYRQGQGVEKNFKTANDYFTRYLDSVSDEVLGSVDWSDAKVLALLQGAADTGHSKAQDLLVEITAQLFGD